MGRALLYASALIISLFLLGWLALFAILPVAFILLLVTTHKPRKKKNASP